MSDQRSTTDGSPAPSLLILTPLVLLALGIGIVILALRPGYSWIEQALAVGVSLATISALLFPLYSWKIERLHEKQMVIEDVAKWPRYFVSMTSHLEGVNEGQISTLERKAIFDLAKKTADELALAASRAPLLTSNQLTYTLVKDLQNWAAKNDQDASMRFGPYLNSMRENARQVQKVLMKDKLKYRLSVDIELGLRTYWEMIIRLVHGSRN